MKLSGIISISGMSGLYKVIAQTKSGIIVESLIDKKRTPAHSSNRISALEDISIFTTGEDIGLKEVLKKINDKEKGQKASVDPKAAEKDLRSYFESVLPEYDKDRVYTSDIKKVIQWYNLLQENDLLKEEETEESGDTKEKAKLKASEEKAKTPKAKAKTTTPKVSGAKVKSTAGVRKTGVA